jgi:hypothetical protein
LLRDSPQAFETIMIIEAGSALEPDKTARECFNAALRSGDQDGAPWASFIVER